MAIILCGSRGYADLRHAQTVLATAMNLFDIQLILSGGARGADSFAPLIAEQWGTRFVEVKPDWGMHDKAAGPKRNQQMLDKLLQQSVDKRLVISFWDGVSRGTYDMMTRAFNANVPVLCCNNEDPILMVPTKCTLADFEHVLEQFSRQTIQL